MKHGVWVAAQVKAKREFSTSLALRAKGYETFVPSYVSVRLWSDRQKECQLPLISGYVFVRTMLERAHGLVVSTPGVVRMVGFGGKVVPINDEEIEQVKAIADSPLRKEPWSYVKQDSQVKIARGSLSGIRGTVIKVKENTMLVVSIEMLQRSVAVHIDRSWVEPAGVEQVELPGLSSEGDRLPKRELGRI